jgi:hypothetical protein
MFAWIVSLLMLFTNRGIVPTAPSAGLNDSGNRHVVHTEDTGTNPTSPPSVDGGTGKGGGT